jgi:hypothetical protein
MEYAALCSEVRQTWAAVADLLRSTPDPEQRVPGLVWNVAELGGHLVTVAQRNAHVARDEPLGWVPEATTHDALARINAAEIAALDLSEPAELASALEQYSEDALTAYGTESERVVRWPQYETQVRYSVGVWLGEFLVHGLDLARALQRHWEIRGTQATAVIDGLLPILPIVVNDRVATRARGCYHVHLRAAGDYAITVDPRGVVTTARDKPSTADLHISAEPVAYLLVGYRRMSTASAIVRGRLRSWGRKPWLALRFASLFERP